MEEAVLEPVEAGEAELEPVEAGDGAQDGAEDGGAELTEGELKGVNLWKTIREPLKTLDAKTVASVRKALFQASEIEKKYPEGLRKIEAAEAAVRQLADDPENADAVPVDELIQNTLAERTFWRDFDTKFQAGSPELIGQMVEANPQSFQKLIVPAMDKFAELNPEGYSSLISGVAVNYLDAAKIPLQFEILDMLLPKSSEDVGTQRIIAAFAAIKETINGLRAMAQKPIVPKVEAKDGAEPNKTADPNMSLEQREMRVKDVEWNREIAPQSLRTIGEEALKVAGGKKFTAQELTKIQTAVREEINSRVALNGKYQQSLKSYLKANNKAAYKQLVASEHKKIIPNAVRRAVNDVLDARAAKPKPGASGGEAAKPKPGAATGAQDGDVRFERISGPPQTLGLKVDHNRTSQKMLVGQKAYIVGRKNPVSWARR